MNDRKTCYHCDRVLTEKIDPLDHLGGFHGICDGCRDFKAAWYADLTRRVGQAPATEKKTP